MNDKKLKQLEPVFADRLKLLREEKGMTQQYVSDYTKIYRSKIVRFENGIASPTYMDLIKLSDLLCVSIDHLVGLEDYPEYMYDLAEYYGLTLIEVNEAMRSGKSLDKDIEEGILLIKFYISLEENLNKLGIANHKEISKMVKSIIDISSNNNKLFKDLDEIIKSIPEEDNIYTIVSNLSNESKNYLIQFIKSLDKKEKSISL